MGNKYKDFWDKQTTSRHRYNDELFYEIKAKEHASFIKRIHHPLGAIDLGCGTGELLAQLSKIVKINVGLDYSNNMLAVAKEKISKNSEMKLINNDIFAYLPNAEEAVWLTTGAINQYLSLKETSRVLDIFQQNNSVKVLYMFDCVDPLRLNAVSLGIRYEKVDIPERSVNYKVLRFFFNAYKRVKFSLFTLLSLYRNFHKIGRMGYAQFPVYWVNEGRKRGLSVEIVSSKFYEYRYHVMIEK